MKKHPWWSEWIAGVQLLLLVGGPLLIFISLVAWLVVGLILLIRWLV